jgi:hypothetical protein
VPGFAVTVEGSNLLEALPTVIVVVGEGEAVEVEV